MRKINEHELGLCAMIDDLEASYQASCAYNETTDKDLDYFRQYMWVMFATMKKQIDSKEDKDLL